ncbi:MAG: outer membrane beta-barrel protein [Chitinophagaceae bacterium]
MKKIFLLIGIACISATAFAQQGAVRIGVGADFGIPTGSFGDIFSAGIGGYAKGLFGVSEHGYATFTTGYSSFKAKGSGSLGKVTWGIVPLLAGYRHHFSRFFAEPQAGYSINIAKATISGVSANESEGAFTWAVGVGFMASPKVELGLRYQSAHKEGDAVSLVGLRLGYNFSLR